MTNIFVLKYNYESVVNLPLYDVQYAFAAPIVLWHNSKTPDVLDKIVNVAAQNDIVPRLGKENHFIHQPSSLSSLSSSHYHQYDNQCMTIFIAKVELVHLILPKPNWRIFLNRILYSVSVWVVLWMKHYLPWLFLPIMSQRKVPHLSFLLMDVRLIIITLLYQSTIKYVYMIM